MAHDELKQDNQPQGGPADDKSAGGQAKGPAARPAPCPVCGKPASAAHDPFCSARCADVDLNRWLTGSYAIPGRPLADEEEAD